MPAFKRQNVCEADAETAVFHYANIYALSRRAGRARLWNIHSYWWRHRFNRNSLVFPVAQDLSACRASPRQQPRLALAPVALPCEISFHRRSIAVLGCPLIRDPFPQRGRPPQTFIALTAPEIPKRAGAVILLAMTGCKIVTNGSIWSHFAFGEIAPVRRHA